MGVTMTVKALVMLAACFLGVQICEAVKPKGTVVIVSMDGMPWQLLNESIAPNLAQVAKEGVKAKYIKTVTPTKTFPNHHSYLTGLFAESHGIVSNTFWDPLYEEEYIFDYDCSTFDPKFYDAAEPIWLTLQNEGGRSGVYFWPGATGYVQNPTFYENYTCMVNCSAIDPKDLPGMRNRTMAGWPPYVHCFANYSAHPFKSRIDKVMGWLKSDEPPSFVAIYIDEPDWKGHEFGPDSSEYRQEVELVDGVVGYFIQSLKNALLLDKVNLMFVTDHSMVSVSSDRQIYLDDYLDRAAYRLIESGAVGHLWPTEGKMDEVYENLTRKQIPHISVYKKEDIPDSFHWKIIDAFLQYLLTQNWVGKSRNLAPPPTGPREITAGQRHRRCLVCFLQGALLFVKALRCPRLTLLICIHSWLICLVYSHARTTDLLTT